MSQMGCGDQLVSNSTAVKANKTKSAAICETHFRKTRMCTE